MQIRRISKKARDAIAASINTYGTQGLKVKALDISFDAPTSVVTVAGTVDGPGNQGKSAAGLRQRVWRGKVNDMLVVVTPTPEAKFHTVVSGDNLSKIAKSYYGDANKYPAIFEANKPMLKHPDKIYPGQMLRIPPL